MSGLKRVIEDANEFAVERLLRAEPVLVDVRPAIEVIPDMKKDMILHSGPPVEWENMCPPQRGGVIGALIYEGLADNPAEAEKMAEEGEVTLEPCHQHQTVGSMSGITSPTMWVHIVENRSHGNTGYCAVYEGRGRTIAFGCHDEETIRRLRWINGVLGPTMHTALKNSGGIELNGIISKALSMGDECHNRNTVSTLIFTYLLSELMLDIRIDHETIREITSFITEPHYNYFLTLAMPACKAMADAAHGVEYSTLVTAMARNGTEFGIRVSGLGDRWFTAPSPRIDGLYFPGFKAEDANPDMGDSSITETVGLGGFAMAASPAIVRLTGGTVRDAIRYTRDMREITLKKNSDFAIPYMDFEGTPTGIDIRKVVETGIVPVIDTGIAHKKPDIGHIGAGITKAPLECFKNAFMDFFKKVSE